MMTGILLVPLMGLVGGVTDYSMASRARSGMQSMLDSAMLAAAHRPGKTRERIQTAQDFMEAQLPRLNLKNTSLNVKISPDGQGLVGELKGSYPTSFLRLVGVRSFDIAVTTDVYTGALER